MSEVEALKHDIERHVAICSEQATRIAELEASGRLAVEAWRRSPSVGYDLTEAMVRLDATVRQVEEQ